MRAENEVFDELEALCALPGYLHVIAYFCQRDTSIVYDKEITPKDLVRLYNTSKRLLRTEISTLVGLVAKVEITLSQPDPDSMQTMITRTEALLEEMHEVLAAPLRAPKDPALMAGGRRAPSDGAMLREPIFYSGESAYEFQYRDFAREKYSRDAEWLERNFGFCVDDAVEVASGAMTLVNDQLGQWMRDSKDADPDSWNWLPIYRMRVEDLAIRSGLESTVVAAVLRAFSCRCGNSFNSAFNRLSEFNATDARPFLGIDEEEFILFLPQAFGESIYDSPFYWMLADDSYRDQATHHRGLFAEEFSAARLAAVFGESRVHKNVIIATAGGDRLGEIDVLVIFANRAMIVQTKSKRLTIAARKGSDQAVRSDFAKGIQAAFDQGVSCAKLLREGKELLIKSDGTRLTPTIPITDIFLFCAVSDSYPALAQQAWHLLNSGETIAGVAVPLVLDVFLLDVLCEILSRPLYFLGYVDSRARMADSVVASHEIAALGFFLKTTFPSVGKDLYALNDDTAIDVNIAMTARRTAISGARVPPGLLVALSLPKLERLMSDIERMEEAATVDFMILLLSMGIRSIEDFAQAYDQMFSTHVDLPTRDITLHLNDSGITIHLNSLPNEEALDLLHAHCERRKYLARATSWYGIGVSPPNGDFRFGVKLDFPWLHSVELDADTAGMRKGFRSFAAAGAASLRTRKIGRNEPCPCGSGKKYKKCCMV
jgi:hypothetical protein